MRPMPRRPRRCPSRAVTGEHERDRAEHEALADAVGRGVDEGAEGRGLTAAAGERAIEDVDESTRPGRRSLRRTSPRRYTSTAAATLSEKPSAVSWFGVTALSTRHPDRAARERARAVGVAVLDRFSRRQMCHGRSVGPARFVRPRRVDERSVSADERSHAAQPRRPPRSRSRNASPSSATPRLRRRG